MPEVFSSCQPAEHDIDPRSAAARSRLWFLTTSAQEELRTWSGMAILPNGSPLDIRAFDADGALYDAKVLQRGEAHLLDINVLMAGPELPIRMIASDDAFLPVKAIAADGKLMDVEATLPEGPKLDGKGVAWSGRIVHIKAMGPDHTLSGVKAISPEGRMYDVKGVRMSDGPDIGKVAGFAISAYIKFLPQASLKNEYLIWSVKAIGTEWYPFGVKAIVKKRSVHEVKAFIENGDRWIMDSKAFVQEKKVAVNKLLNDDALISGKAVAADGWSHDIQAIRSDGRKLDVKGTAEDGNVIYVKVVDGEKKLGIKSISGAGAQI